MFGYVTICKEQLNEAAYDDFCAYYCGLCRQIGKNCSQLARLGLSYDITFLAIVLSSLSDEGESVYRRCAVKRGRKCAAIQNDAAVSYAADMGVLLTYLKLSDDWQDERSVTAFAKMLIFKRAVGKAKKRYPLVFEQIQKQLRRLSELEKARCPHIDETADCFAKILELLFTPNIITDEAERRTLGSLGYNIGRWIYIIDAYADIEKDRKKKSYNTFLCAQSCDKERIRESLTFTLDNAVAAYNLLNIKRNGEIIENILYKGLALRQGQILGETNEPI